MELQFLVVRFWLVLWYLFKSYILIALSILSTKSYHPGFSKRFLTIGGGM